MPDNSREKVRGFRNGVIALTITTRKALGAKIRLTHGTDIDS